MRHSNKRKKSSDPSPWFTGIETSNDTNDVDDEPKTKKFKEVITFKCSICIRIKTNHRMIKINCFTVWNVLENKWKATKEP